MHYHVVEFINGCLNDYDSGPYDTLEDARGHIKEVINHPCQAGKIVPAGEDRYIVDDLYIMKIEECHEDCEEE
jgi:hypothetical protein